MRKRNLIITICFLTFNICHAQFSKKTIYAAGFGTYSYERGTDIFLNSKATVQNVMLTPSIGIFPVKNLIAGIKFSWNSTRSDYDYSSTGGSQSKNLSRLYSAGPFIRYYIFKGLYAETGLFFGRGKVSSTYTLDEIFNGNVVDSQTGIVERKYSSRGYFVGLGYTIFLSKVKNIGLDLGILYKGYSKDDLASKGFSAGLGISGFLFRQKE